MSDDALVYRIDVRIRAPVQDTEVTDRVAEAVRNLFPEADLEERAGAVVGEAHSMDRFSELLFRQEILDTARKQFFEAMDRTGFSFELKKQAAFEGVVNFAVGNPDELGDIEVEVRVEEPDPETFVDHVAPATAEGQPVTRDGG